MSVPAKAFALVPGLTFIGMVQRESTKAKPTGVVFVEVERGETSASSTNALMATIQASKSLESDKQPFAILTKGVGLKCQGRSGCYDMYYFMESDNFYAVDYLDNAIVYELQFLLN